MTYFCCFYWKGKLSIF